MARDASLGFKKRIWLIPIVAILAFLAGIGVALNSNQAASRLVAVDEPYLTFASDFHKALEDARYALQAAAQEGDKGALVAAQSIAARARTALVGMRGIEEQQQRATDLGASFERYWEKAGVTTRLLLGEGQGDMQAAVHAMQVEQKSVQEAAEATLTDARNRFRISMDSTARSIDRGAMTIIGLGVLVAVGLTLLSFFVIRGVGAQLGGDPEVAAQVVRRVASGDLRDSGVVARSASLLGHISLMRVSLVDMLGTVHSASSGLLQAASGIASGSDNLARRTDQQAASLEQTAAALEEITSTVRSTAENAVNLDQLAREAASSTEDGARVMSEVSGTMDRIKSDSGRMTEILSVIDGLAFQTNILALNAAVEAARAGEQGRGFAVVAQEVRNLALRSAKSATEIKELLQASAAGVEDGAGHVKQAAARMDRIRQAIGEVSTIVSEISTASREQTEGLAGITTAVAQMESLTQENAQLAQRTASAAREVSERADDLENAVSQFRL